ncbi:class I SAM-dependent methyltransferase [Aliikangiella sp. IMCC44359]|uniref:class I SAM-dependent methyltransferase n=1 Tax=Aliikangiella sp. IMCC44359 TaxID=3459125 RepID=UPI00403B2EE0
MQTAPWWKKLYDGNLADILLENKDPQESANTYQFLQKYALLKPGQRVFDQCCGTGRLAIELATSHQVIGVDLINQYIELANQKAKEKNINIELYCGDAFEFKPSEPVDVAINWWTSFGYAKNDEQNYQMILRAVESLKKGGFYALDFMNVPGLFKHFKEDVVTHKKQGDQEITLIRKSSFDFECNTLKKDWIYFLSNGDKITHKSEVCLYQPSQLISFFKQAGLSDVKIFGDLSGKPLTLDSPRCIVIGRKND